MSWLITTSQPVPLDPYRSNVSLLLHGDGANGSTTITDSSPTPKTVTAAGNAQISTAQSKFGGASLAFDGTGDYLTTPHSSEFDFAAGNFTIECWVRLAAVGQQWVFSQTVNGAGYVPIHFGVSSSSGQNRVYFLGSFSGTGWEINGSFTRGATEVTLNTWHHIALVRNGANFSAYLNGVADLSVTPAQSALMSTTATPYIGAGSAGSSVNGYIDDLRITKGVARYTGTFTPPTAAFPDI
jgi:hypothetical protein